MTREEILKTINSAKKDLYDRYSVISNVEATDHQNDEMAISQTDDGVFDITDTVSDLAQAIDDLSEMITTLTMEV